MLGTIIKNARNAKNISRQKILDGVNIPSTTFQNYEERGIKKPLDPAILKQLAKSLHKNEIDIMHHTFEFLKDLGITSYSKMVISHFTKLQTEDDYYEFLKALNYGVNFFVTENVQEMYPFHSQKDYAVIKLLDVLARDKGLKKIDTIIIGHEYNLLRTVIKVKSRIKFMFRFFDTDKNREIEKQKSISLDAKFRNIKNIKNTTKDYKGCDFSLLYYSLHHFNQADGIEFVKQINSKYVIVVEPLLDRYDEKYEIIKEESASSFYWQSLYSLDYGALKLSNEMYNNGIKYEENLRLKIKDGIDNENLLNKEQLMQTFEQAGFKNIFGNHTGNCIDHVYLFEKQ